MPVHASETGPRKRAETVPETVPERADLHRMRHLCTTLLAAALLVSSFALTREPAQARPSGEEVVDTIRIDPGATYLATTIDDHFRGDWNIIILPRQSQPIDLAARGIEPGDRIHLTALGDFTTAIPGTIGDREFDIDETARDHMIAVFSTSNELDDRCWLAEPPNFGANPCDNYNRVVGAVDPAEDYGIATTYTGFRPRELETDIDEDFFVNNEGEPRDGSLVTVPAGARYLFAAAYDDGMVRGVAWQETKASYYWDNLDQDRDFTLEIARIVEGADEVSLAIDGYSVQGALTSGNFQVAIDGSGVQRVAGSGRLAGPSGGEARVALSLNRFLFFPVYFGSVSVNDSAARVNRSVMVLFGSVRRGPGKTAVASTGYVDFGRFPWRFGNVRFTITDDA